MGLTKRLKETVIEDLQQVDLFMFEWYATKNKNSIRFLYTQGIIDDSSIENALEEAVFKIARKQFNTMNKVEKGVLWADSWGRPEYLAYALSHDKFSEQEIRQIPFDHGETAKTFSKYGRENLLSELRKELLSPKPVKKKEYSLHSECLSCP